MAQFLTKQKLRSKRFLRDEMFRCTQPGGEHPTDQNWMCAIYMSIVLENGVELGICDTHSLFRVIKPFTEGLYRTTFYHRDSINSDYIISFQIMIVTENELVRGGEFFYRSDRNPFEPEMMGIKRNLNLFYHLNQPLAISIRSKFNRFTAYNPDDVESVLPKPLEKTFKVDQCVTCLDRKPDVLFIKCNHICVCNECEETHPSTQCPCCRMGISKRLLI